ncbi:hypothetical protein E0L15_07665 [Pseudoflavonifractor sp. SW1122]|uniref:hypothetical protein n=1 Tax=Pseudoflavonifractor sp. SW1122 TaxID=2530044 RepID=UPI001439430A|nr:hypothetical protein [Pseudoflavonifractor sp. SW1122]NJE74474.1 hypothetical protein [Pseudoflavonifractor sp. SW1122]
MSGCLFFHKWGKWKEESSCKMSRTCLKCNKREERENHNFVFDHYDKNCEEVLVCTKCQAELYGNEKHDFVLDHYDGNCVEVFICQRCHAVKHGNEKHKWGEYQYYEKECCTQISVCERCGLTRYKENVHNEISYQRDDQCETITECVRCHQKHVASKEHVWSTSVHTYIGCLEFAKRQIEFRIQELQEKIQCLQAQPEYSAVEISKIKEKRSRLSLELSTVISKLKEIKDDEEKNTPAKVCEQCRFITKTGKRVKRIDVKGLNQSERIEV